MAWDAWSKWAAPLPVFLYWATTNEPLRSLYFLELGNKFFWNWVSWFSTAGSKFLSIACWARMVSAGDNEIYTGSGL
jgi:hypothetical protein